MRALLVWLAAGIASGLGATPVAGAAPRAEVSPPFAIGSPAALFGDRVADVVSFFQVQRDGADVIPGPLHRKPAHLRDRALAYYACPKGGGDALRAFNGHKSRFVDNVSAWQTVEPAIDFDAAAAFAFALSAVP